MSIRKAVYVMVEPVTIGHDSVLEMFVNVTGEYDEAKKWQEKDPDNRRVIRQFVQLKGVQDDEQ